MKKFSLPGKLSSFIALCLLSMIDFKLSAQQCPGSLFFDNNNPSVDLPLSNQYYTGTNGGYTWECWFKLAAVTDTTKVRPLISAIDQVTFEDQYLGFGWDGGWYDEPASKLVWKVDGPNSQFPSQTNCSHKPSGGFIVGVWYHAAGVMNYTSQLATLYVNGVAVDNRTITSLPITRTIPTELSFNWNNILRPLYGNMDEVRIWNVPRTAQQIQSNYNTCLTGNQNNLVLYYRCNQPGGTTVTDATPNNNHGTFNIMPQWSTQDAPASGTSCAGYFSAVSTPTAKCSNSGQQFTLTASGANSYSWSTGPAIPTITVNPSSTTVYTVTGNFTGSCSTQQTVSVIISNCVGINSQTVSENFIVYPNPSLGSALVKSGKSGAFSLYDVSGKLILTRTMETGSETIEINNLKLGLYFYSFHSGSEQMTGKLVVE